MRNQSWPPAEIGFALVMIAIAGAVLWNARLLPAGIYEPLGPAPVPRIVAILIIVLSLVVVFQAIGRTRHARIDTPPDDVPRNLDALLILALTIAYVALMAFRFLEFASATSLFLVITILLLERFRWRSLLYAVPLALFLAYGLRYIFTKILIIDLS